jgi:formylglycine-generating enzyme required for sulfatase activity
MRALALALVVLLDASPKRLPDRIVVDLDRAGGIRLEFVRIRAGTFRMGDGATVHEVRISRDFWMQTTEVTQAQWEALGFENRSEFRGATNPVDNVSWNDAQEFLSKLAARVPGRRKPGLPTEAEWEYACRAGTTTTWCCGNDEEALEAYAWYGQRGGEGSHPVAQKKPNAWGLYDMHGNVLEWCHDYWGEAKAEKAVDPQGPDSGTGRVIRGGGWYGVADLTASPRRHNYGQDFRGRVNGFRAALR